LNNGNNYTDCLRLNQHWYTFKIRLKINLKRKQPINKTSGFLNYSQLVASAALTVITLMSVSAASADPFLDKLTAGEPIRIGFAKEVPWAYPGEGNDGVIYVDRKPLTHTEKNGGLVWANHGHIRKIRTDIGMVFQHFNLFPHMTTIENCIKAPLQVLGMCQEEAHERAFELLKRVGLEDKIDQYQARLSSDQQQRVAITRTLAMRPKIMLFDEGTSALDPEVIGEVLNAIRMLNFEHDLTMPMVTTR
jgi:energy-coupling factor transporter ATP-binding protein EcfA2